MTQKPKQIRIAKCSDPAELMEAVEDAMYHIREAMDSVKGYGETEDTFAALSDLHDDLYAVYEDCEVNVAAAHADMLRDMEREYRMGVL